MVVVLFPSEMVVFVALVVVESTTTPFLFGGQALLEAKCRRLDDVDDIHAPRSCGVNDFDEQKEEDMFDDDDARVSPAIQ